MNESMIYNGYNDFYHRNGTPIYKSKEELNKMKPVRQIEYGSKEWYLYHAKQNINPLGTLIFINVFLFLFKGGIPVLLMMWLFYFIWCQMNNEALNKDPMIILKREEYRIERLGSEKYSDEFREKYPESVPGTPEFERNTECFKKWIEEQRYKRL